MVGRPNPRALRERRYPDDDGGGGGKGETGMTMKGISPSLPCGILDRMVLA